MFGKPKKKSIILRQDKTPDDSRFLGAEIKANGDLLFEGQDYGSGVERFFGYSEYEWCWTIKAANLPKLQKALAEEGGLLELLEKKFSNDKAADLHDFLKNNDIPFESWSRVGD
jgi:hypothetical protein